MDTQPAIAAWSLSVTQIVFVTAVALFTAVAAVTDLRMRKLPNWLTVPSLLAGLAFHTITGGVGGLTASLAGFATGFGILLVLWLIGGGGGGDVKLMGAVGAWLGARMTLYVFLLSTLFAILFSVAMLAWRALNQGYGKVRRRHFASTKLGEGPPANEGQSAQRAKRRLLPYALPVAIGTWVVLLWQVMSHRP